jgi:hypothetical protein
LAMAITERTHRRVHRARVAAVRWGSRGHQEGRELAAELVNLDAAVPGSLWSWKREEWQ